MAVSATRWSWSGVGLIPVYRTNCSAACRAMTSAPLMVFFPRLSARVISGVVAGTRRRRRRFGAGDDVGIEGQVVGVGAAGHADGGGALMIRRGRRSPIWAENFTSRTKSAGRRCPGAHEPGTIARESTERHFGGETPYSPTYLTALGIVTPRRSTSREHDLARCPHGEGGGAVGAVRGRRGPDRHQALARA